MTKWSHLLATSRLLKHDIAITQARSNRLMREALSLRVKVLADEIKLEQVNEEIKESVFMEYLNSTTGKFLRLLEKIEKHR